jgi:protein kinase-like protein
MPGMLELLRQELAGRYRIERELGAGGMATVFLAEDLKHGRQVAVKVLSPEVAAAIGPERFLREIETVAQLHHPHIVPLYDSGRAGALLYSSCRSSRASRCATGSPARSSCRSRMRCASRERWRTPSTTPTGAGWCTATSIPATS